MTFAKLRGQGRASVAGAGLTLLLSLGLASAQSATTPPQTDTSTSATSTAATSTVATSTSATSTAATPATGRRFSLQDALNLLPASPKWKQADLTYQQAQLALRSAQAAAGLSLAVGGGATAVSGSGLSATVNANASLNVLPWSSTQDAVRSAERALLTAQTTLNTTRAALRETLAQQYFAAALAVSSLSVAQQTSDLDQRLLTQAQAQRAQNTITQETLLTRQANAQDAFAALQDAQTTLQSDLFALESTLGSSLGSVTLSTAPALPGTPGDLSALIARGLAQRAEIVGDNEQIADAQAALASAQRSRYLPQLSGNLKYGGANGLNLQSALDLQSGNLTASLSAPLTSSDSGSATGASGSGAASSASNTFSLGVSATYYLLDPAADAKIATEQAGVQDALLKLGLDRQTVELDIRQDYAKLESALAALTAARTRLGLAQTALTTTQAQFDNGLAIATDVTSAQVNVLNAQQNLNSAVSAAQLAAVTLTVATGGTP